MTATVKDFIPYSETTTTLRCEHLLEGETLDPDTILPVDCEDLSGLLDGIEERRRFKVYCGG